MDRGAKTAARNLEERARSRRRAREERAARAEATVRHEASRRMPPGGRAWLIGSLAWGGFGPRSDVDLVVSGLSGRDITALEGAVAERLGVGVDILVLEDLPPRFRERVEAEGVPLHAP